MDTICKIIILPFVGSISLSIALTLSFIWIVRSLDPTFWHQRCILRLKNAAHETLNVVLMENKLTDGFCAFELEREKKH